MLLVAAGLVIAGWRRMGSISDIVVHLGGTRRGRRRRSYLPSNATGSSQHGAPLDVARGGVDRGLSAACAVLCRGLSGQERRRARVGVRRQRSPPRPSSTASGSIAIRWRSICDGRWSSTIIVGELEFGMQQARVSAEARNREQFLEHWQRKPTPSRSSIPRSTRQLWPQGMPGRIIARDARSIVVARS